MCLNWTSELNVMTIWIYLEPEFFNFERLDISWASFVHQCQKLWSSKFNQSFCVQFRSSQQIMGLNRTSEWKVVTIWISRELPFLNFECLYISWASIIHPCEKLRSSELDQSFRVQFRASRYIICLNRTSKWNVTTIWISLELLFFNFECFDISWASFVHPCQ